MLETMYHFNGVGLAAVQVGVLKQIIVIDIEDEKGPYILINPKILKKELMSLGDLISKIFSLEVLIISGNLNFL